jgi:hypothetical protein
VKQVDLIKAILALEYYLVRRGAKDDWYWNPTTGFSQPVPRNREIKEGSAKHILKTLSKA